MCYVKVDRDTERRLRLTSIAPIIEEEENNNADHGGLAEDDEILDELLMELARIRLSTVEMARKIIDLKKKQKKRQNND